MEYTKLGNTDITISKLCVGCMSFGQAGTISFTLTRDSSVWVREAHGLISQQG